MYFSQKYNQNPKPHNWTTHHIESLITRAKNREEFSYAHETHYLYNVFEEYSIAGQQGIVLGSEMPWLEGILLAQGEHLSLPADNILEILSWLDLCAAMTAQHLQTYLE